MRSPERSDEHSPAATAASLRTNAWCSFPLHSCRTASAKVVERRQQSGGGGAARPPCGADAWRRTLKL
jgi:hypothetical protein